MSKFLLVLTLWIPQLVEAETRCEDLRVQFPVAERWPCGLSARNQFLTFLVNYHEDLELRQELSNEIHSILAANEVSLRFDLDFFKSPEPSGYYFGDGFVMLSHSLASGRFGGSLAVFALLHELGHMALDHKRNYLQNAPACLFEAGGLQGSCQNAFAKFKLNTLQAHEFAADALAFRWWCRAGGGRDELLGEFAQQPDFFSEDGYHPSFERRFMRLETLNVPGCTN